MKMPATPATRSPLRFVLPGLASLLLASLAASASEPALHIEGSPDAPVRVVNFRYDTSPAGMTVFHYDILNQSGQGLLAVEVRWTAQAAHRQIVFSNRTDNWLTGPVTDGKSLRFQVSNVADPAGAPVTTLTGVVTYAQLEDGSEFGTDVARIGADVASDRRITQTTYAGLLDTFNASGAEALNAKLQEQNVTHGEAPAVQESTSRLLGVLGQEGLDGVVKELERVLALPLPESR